MMQQRTQLLQQQRDEVQEKLLNADQNVERLAMQRRDAQVRCALCSCKHALLM